MDNGYQDLSFPFDRLEAPDLTMATRWDLGQLIGMLHTWSAVVRHDRQQRAGALTLVERDLAAAWGRGRRAVTWPLYVHVGRV